MGSIIVLDEETRKRKEEKAMVSQFAAQIVLGYFTIPELKTLIDDARESAYPFSKLWNGFYNMGPGYTDGWLDNFHEVNNS